MAKGGKREGAGRHTLRDEKARQQELQQLWDEFKPKFRKLGLNGDSKILNAVFGKYVPDKVEVDNPKQNEALEKLTESVKQMIENAKDIGA
jgi:hypothetical protein